IISAPDTESTKLYQQFAQIIPRLKPEVDYKMDEKERHVSLTEEGISKVEKFLNIENLYDPTKITYVHHLEQSLKAEVLFKREKDYIVKDGQVIIVDDFTGRLMEGRRYSEGLHQAIEAKEGVAVQRESRTLATITFQNYFRIYKKLAGMTGTALTSAEEFAKVYKLDVMEIPTHKKMMRKDLADIIYKTEKGKFDAIVKDIKEISAKGQPILVGTIAIEKSEYLSSLLTKAGVAHEVLNAKQHEREAGIITSAGQKGSITIATNMAGRGTDIKLGEGVRELGGLLIIGSERHEARRIDNQLRGRAGRQGDPGMSQFYVSLEDELMRRFGGDKMKAMMDKLSLPEDQPIQNAIISKTIESAQSKIEGFNFDIRKHVLDYDDVMNKQREVIYKKRQAVLEDKDTRDMLLQMISDEIKKIVAIFSSRGEEKWQTKKMFAELNTITPLGDLVQKRIKEISIDKTKNESQKISNAIEFIFGEFKKSLAAKEAQIGEENMKTVRKMVMLQTIDSLWMNHLDEIDYLRQGIGLRGYGQRDPLIEYKKESYNLFSLLIDNIRSSIVNTIFKVAPAPTSEVREIESNLQKMADLKFSGATDEVEQFGALKKMKDSASYNHAGGEAPKQKPLVNTNTVGRNDPCPCGSGKKYKKCHGK
ncbi:MAG: SEC-C metal-binding domain-containing protein, partial [Candidatus Moranbacteria bacterium]|nr:SEC-C metal-binding domain-containing protein [Candidatus Moranbacteria bacterium]